ncbi:acyltransferase family protein [Caulobacter sp. 17J65-9]|uniref:acyltransferase family protein n=1 Tax=Caulobacter sp. 17J65-9 TaxID=2709382 RepID=UPI0013CDA52D|nr:acyltransferase family protein [Caulobacter sp. 17J65-9]NEX93987.1 acyltransferase family protein [Caulobacter sp. 17J65-9]
MHESERFHALDAVRGFALLAGVTLHAAVAFLPSEVPLWPAMDDSRSVELAVLFYVLHVFRMTVFFLIAGFFARMSLERRGLASFAWDRIKRIGLTFAIFWPLVFASLIAVIVWNAAAANGGTIPDGPPPPPMTVETFPLTHLWFLYLLLWFYPAMLVLRGLGRLVDGQGRVAALLDRLVRLSVGGWTPILPALAVALVMCLDPEWRMWFGVRTPDFGLIPNPAALSAFGLAFAIGWMVHRQQDLLAVWARRWAFLILLGAGFSAAGLAIVGLEPTLDKAPTDGTQIAYAVIYGLAVWGWTLGLIGAAVRFLSGHSPARRYVADAAYWIYLVHIPVVMAAEVLVARLDLPWTVKFPMVLGGSLLVLFASYQLLVRHSFIGRFLSGRKKPAKAKAAAVPELEPA